MSIVRKNLSNVSVSKESLKAMKAVKDADIDYSDIPELDDNWFENAEIRMPETKERLTVRFDRDIVAYFKNQGRGYQTRMNAVLRSFMESHR